MSAPINLTVRTVEIARALAAAAAALMITFSTDHSAELGLAVFSGFVMFTGIILLVAAWMVYQGTDRNFFIISGVVSVLAGMATGVPPWRSVTLFFVVVIAWAALMALLEILRGLAARRRQDPGARDAITLGAITALFAIVLAVVPPQYAWDYSVAGAGNLTLTGITLGVGIFGAFAAITAVFLGISAFSPQRGQQPTQLPAPLPTTTSPHDAAAAATENGSNR